MPLKCRTAELGGHIDGCDSCGNITIVTTLAATDIVPSVRATNAKIDPLEKQNSSAILPRGFTLPDVNSLAITSAKIGLRYALKRHVNNLGKAKEMQME
jgi:hypothetical protein